MSKSFLIIMRKKKALNIIPAFLAALHNASLMRSCAGSISGDKVMNDSTIATVSSLVKYW